MMTLLLIWLNMNVATLNAMLQFLVIYRYRYRYRYINVSLPLTFIRILSLTHTKNDIIL